MTDQFQPTDADAFPIPPWSNPATTRCIVIGTVPDIVAANAAGFKLEPHAERDHQRAEMLIVNGGEIDLAHGFRELMAMAATYPSYEAVYSRLSALESDRLDYDGLIATDARCPGCDDPRVIIRELTKMFGDEQIRDLVNERIEAIRLGTTVTIHELNAAQPTKIVKCTSGSTSVVSPKPTTIRNSETKAPAGGSGAAGWHPQM